MNIQQSYRESAVQGASPVELVIRLYEQIIKDLREVSAAIEQSDIQLRSDRITHAILVVGHLQSSLDFASGGKVAADLETFYNSLRQRLVELQFHPSMRAVAQLIADVLAVREAWIVVERTESGSAQAGTAAVLSGPASPTEPTLSSASAQWEA